MLSQEILQELKNALEEEHNKLVEELKAIARPSTEIKGDWKANYPQFETTEYGSHASLNIEADEVEEYEERLAAEQSLETRLLEVNKALERLVKRAYGVCTKCKKEISIERLRANPAAEFDTEHAS